MQMVKDLLSQGWIGTVVGVAGIVLAVIFYLRSKRKARLAFQYDHVMLVGGRGAAFPDEVEIRFSGRAVPRVTASKVVIWNCGDRTINGSDVVAGDPLRMEVPEAGDILSYSILRQTRTVNAWKIDQSSPSCLNLSFDFIDPGDGINFEVLHTQPGSEFDVAGTVKGMPAGIRNYGRALWSANRHRRSRPFPLNRTRLVLAIAIVIGIGMMLFGLTSPQLAQWFPAAFALDEPTDLNRIRWGFMVGGLLYAVFPGFLLWIRRRRYPAVLEPELEDEDNSQEAKEPT